MMVDKPSGIVGKEVWAIIDLSSLMYRAWHAGKRAEVDGAYIFTRMLLSLLRELKPTRVTIAEDRLDSPETRRAVYPDYKLKDRDPEETNGFLRYSAVCKFILEVMEFPRVSVSKHEADDVIASCVAQKGLRGPFVLVSSDKDLQQLVYPGQCFIYDLTSKRYWSHRSLFTEKGYTALQLPEILALMGDASDNIPGVPGVGIKTAIKWVQQGGILEGVFKRLDDLEPKRLQQPLRERQEQVFMARRLVKLQNTLELPDRLLELSLFRPTRSWIDQVSELFRALLFGRQVLGALELL